MKIEINTTTFNLNELQTLLCYQYCNAVENGTNITIEISDDFIGSFISCLSMQSVKFDLLYQNNALLINKTLIIEQRMAYFMRIKTMIKQILAAIGEHPNFKIEDLNR